MRVAQIELPLDAAPRFVLELAPAIKVVDQLPLGGDQRKLDLVVKLDELGMAIVAVASENFPCPSL